MRDAQGNPLAIYDNAGSTINWKEQDLYGSSRLGTWTPGADPSAWLSSGNKQYELTNHLGNVLATVSDRLLQVAPGNTLTGLTADVITAQDYYPFGMLQPGRQSVVENGGSSTVYRYGFNGKENDDEVKGVGNQQDYGMRIYDPRAGRFLSVDPLTQKYSWYTPYQFAGNKPIRYIDRDGEEEEALAVFAGPPGWAYIGAKWVIIGAIAGYTAYQVAKHSDEIIAPFRGAPGSLAKPQEAPAPTVYRPASKPDKKPNISPDNNPKPIPQFPIVHNDNDDEKKEYFIHYTNEKNILGIAATNVILPSAKNKIYLTKEFLTEKEVENLLFIGDPRKKGYGKYMTIFKVDPDQSSNIKPVPGNRLEYVHEGGSLRIRTGNLIYIGPNVKPQ